MLLTLFKVSNYYFIILFLLLPLISFVLRHTVRLFYFYYYFILFITAISVIQPTTYVYFIFYYYFIFMMVINFTQTTQTDRQTDSRACWWTVQVMSTRLWMVTQCQRCIRLRPGILRRLRIRSGRRLIISVRKSLTPAHHPLQRITEDQRIRGATTKFWGGPNLPLSTSTPLPSLYLSFPPHDKRMNVK